MSERFLTAKVYQDSVTPEVSTEYAIAGLDIVKEVAPWIRLEREQRELQFGNKSRAYINVDLLTWPRLEADLNIVITKQTIVGNDEVQSDGSLNVQKLQSNQETIGWAFHWTRVNSKRIALINVRGIRRAEFTVAHEIGHLLGVQKDSENYHCEDKKCLMFPTQFVYGKADRNFCACCSEQLHDNSLKLRSAKSGRLAVARNAKVF